MILGCFRGSGSQGGSFAVLEFLRPAECFEVPSHAAPYGPKQVPFTHCRLQIGIIYVLGALCVFGSLQDIPKYLQESC